MLRKLAIALFTTIMMLIVGTRPVQAQACPANSCQLQFSVAAAVSSTLSCSVTKGVMDFGTHFRSEGLIGSTEANQLRVLCTVDPKNGTVDVSFPTLPDHLDGPNGATLPLLYGSESLRLYDANGSVGQAQGTDPHNPVSFNITSGFLTAALGENGANAPTAEVSVDFSNATAAGGYSGTIVMQVALR